MRMPHLQSIHLGTHFEVNEYRPYHEYTIISAGHDSKEEEKWMNHALRQCNMAWAAQQILQPQFISAAIPSYKTDARTGLSLPSSPTSSSLLFNEQHDRHVLYYSSIPPSLSAAVTSSHRRSMDASHMLYRFLVHCAPEVVSFEETNAPILMVIVMMVLAGMAMIMKH